MVGIGAGRLHADVGTVTPLTRRHIAVLIVFAATFLIMVYGVIPFDEMGLSLPVLGWWFPELSALFLVAGIVDGPHGPAGRGGAGGDLCFRLH